MIGSPGNRFGSRSRAVSPPSTSIERRGESSSWSLATFVGTVAVTSFGMKHPVHQPDAAEGTPEAGRAATRLDEAQDRCDRHRSEAADWSTRSTAATCRPMRHLPASNSRSCPTYRHEVGQRLTVPDPNEARVELRIDDEHASRRNGKVVDVAHCASTHAVVEHGYAGDLGDAAAKRPPPPTVRHAPGTQGPLRLVGERGSRRQAWRQTCPSPVRASPFASRTLATRIRQPRATRSAAQPAWRRAGQARHWTVLDFRAARKASVPWATAHHAAFGVPQAARLEAGCRIGQLPAWYQLNGSVGPGQPPASDRSPDRDVRPGPVGLAFETAGH